MARAPVSKTDWFGSKFKGRSEKLSLSASKRINRLIAVSECVPPAWRTDNGSLDC
jgi:hypothetical protein